MPRVSICIPTFNQTEFLRRTLESVSVQTFRDFEVIVSDDSTNNDVEQLVTSFAQQNNIVYSRNKEPLGSPANWNHALDLANGEFIKIMHHDDWFCSENSLQVFVDEISKPGIDFVFCDSQILNVRDGKMSYNVPPQDFLRKLRSDPLILFNNNRIGAPTATIFRNNKMRFDTKMKFLVDIDFYIRYLTASRFSYINTPLITNTSQHEGQVTSQSMNPETQVGENLYLYKKHFGNKFPGLHLKMHFIRLFRNYGIRRASQLDDYDVSWYFRMLAVVANLDRPFRH